jgi:hypothetical protein
MLIKTSSTYDDYVPGSTISSTDDEDKDGADVGQGTLRDRDFWTNAPTHPTRPGLGFSTTEWDFGTVVSNGYPALRGLGGQ